MTDTDSGPRPEQPVTSGATPADADRPVDAPRADPGLRSRTAAAEVDPAASGTADAPGESGGGDAAADADDGDVGGEGAARRRRQIGRATWRERV